jgi:hypothetical protein
MEAARRNSRGSGIAHEVLVTLEPGKSKTPMKDRLLRLVIALSAVVATALAGGASLRGF